MQNIPAACTQHHMGVVASKHEQDSVPAGSLAASSCQDAKRCCAAGPVASQHSAVLHQCMLLHSAVRSGQHQAVRAVFTALAEASKQEDTSSGADGELLAAAVDSRDAAGRTPLIVAARKGYAECVRELLRTGVAEIEVADRYGCTCLHYAALKGSPAAASLLLEHASRHLSAAHRARLINRRNAGGFSALAYAAWSGSAPCARLLLQSGADPLACNYEGFDRYLPLPPGSSPLHVAAARAHEGVALAILEHYALQRVSCPPGRRPPVDPRHSVNVYGHTPAVVAHHQGAPLTLEEALSPRVPVGRVVDVSGLIRDRGPRTLQQIAAKAWRAHLLSTLEGLSRPQDPPPAAHNAFAHCGGGSGGACSAEDAGRGEEDADRDEEEEEEEEVGSATQVEGLQWCAADGGGHPRSFGGDSCTSVDASSGGNGRARAACPKGAAACSASAAVPGATAGSFMWRQESLSSSIHTEVRLEDVEIARSPDHRGDEAAASEEDDDDDDEASVCGVCLEPPAVAVLLRACGHRLCLDCTKGVVGTSSDDCSVAPACPFCRSRIVEFDLDLASAGAGA